VTIDALGCQKEIARQIVEGGGDYVLAVKQNQPTLYAAISDYFLHLHEIGFSAREVRQLKTVDQGHGRLEDRYYYITALPESMIAFRDEWAGLTSIGQVVSVTMRDGKEVSEVRQFILSTQPEVKRFARSNRGHWGIENSLHWTLDITFREDESRIRKDHGPENFASLRRAALGMLKQDKSKGSVKKKRKRAGWNNDALLTIVQNGR
jgi:predicted transposase YbfD/YdcC